MTTKPIGEEDFAHNEERSCEGCGVKVSWDADTLQWWVPYGYGNPPPYTYRCTDGERHRVMKPESLQVTTTYRLEYWDEHRSTWARFASHSDEDDALDGAKYSQGVNPNLSIRMLTETVVNARRTDERRF